MVCTGHRLQYQTINFPNHNFPMHSTPDFSTQVKSATHFWSHAEFRSTNGCGSSQSGLHSGLMVGGVHTEGESGYTGGKSKSNSHCKNGAINCIFVLIILAQICTRSFRPSPPPKPHPFLNPPLPPQSLLSLPFSPLPPAELSTSTSSVSPLQHSRGTLFSLLLQLSPFRGTSYELVHACFLSGTMDLQNPWWNIQVEPGHGTLWDKPFCPKFRERGCPSSEVKETLPQ